MKGKNDKILQIITAPADLWLPSVGWSTPRQHPPLGFGRLMVHTRVVYLALVESGEPEGGAAWDEEPQYARWVEMRGVGIMGELDDLDFSGSGPCSLVEPGEWACEGHFEAVDEATYLAEQERQRLTFAARLAARAVKA